MTSRLLSGEKDRNGGRLIRDAGDLRSLATPSTEGLADSRNRGLHSHSTLIRLLQKSLLQQLALLIVRHRFACVQYHL